MNSICRLCANSKDEIDLTAQISELESKLALCCGWYPTENETKLPTKVCGTCVDELDKCYCFAQSVRDAEIKLKKLLAEQNDSITIEVTEFNDLIADDTIKVDPNIYSLELKEVDSSFDNYDASEAIFDDPITDSDTERSNSSKIEKSLPDSDPFLDHLNEEDRIVDGTVSTSGVSKLEQLYPEMKTTSWTNCVYKCDKCNLTYEGIGQRCREKRIFGINDDKMIYFYGSP